jgi:glucose-6-phosphate isomerase
MKLEFYNCPKPEDFKEMDSRLLGNDKLLSPEFIRYKPDFELIKKASAEYQKFENILVIGHGGSITSFYGFYNSLIFQTDKKAFFLSTVDPDYIFELKKELKPENTLVIAVSKSGENTTLLEAFAHFSEYTLLVITGKASPLRAMAEKLNAKIITHPPIGGRFTGLTEVALIPAAIAGLDAEKLYEGAKTFYNLFKEDNLAFRAASVFYQLEQKGFVDVFMPFYSHYLFSMSNLIVQLCHESFGKNGKGQTYLASEAPESQHHTNQRFFGGIKNICGLFVGVENFAHLSVTQYPASTHSVQIKAHALFDINKIPLSKSMESETLGTLEDAKIQGIPLAYLSISSFTASEIGALAAFWQLYAVYASVLRGADPFNQPQVENSKNISFSKRLQYKGLL